MPSLRASNTRSGPQEWFRLGAAEADEVQHDHSLAQRAAGCQRVTPTAHAFLVLQSFQATGLRFLAGPAGFSFLLTS
jgi:hypothetical protein